MIRKTPSVTARPGQPRIHFQLSPFPTSSPLMQERIVEGASTGRSSLSPLSKAGFLFCVNGREEVLKPGLGVRVRHGRIDEHPGVGSMSYLEGMRLQGQRSHQRMMQDFGV